MLKTQIDATCDKHFTLPRHDFNNKGMFTLIGMLTNSKTSCNRTSKRKGEKSQNFLLKKVKDA